VHELSVVAGLFEILEAQAAEYGAVKITSVKIRVGRLSGVVPDLLLSAFDAYKKGTKAEEAVLEIEAVAFRFRCRVCGGESFPEEPPYVCAACGSAEIELLGGMDLVVERIEIEAPEP
jgi:hydrogenase nickel incorporation protein HypA/HybF